MRLALFDLDHTLVSGDSDVLWSRFLVGQGLLEPSFRERSEEMAVRYGAGTVNAKDYHDFYSAALAGYSLADLEPLRRRFLNEEIQPRIPEDARTLLEQHRSAGDTLVLTTATNRVVSELTALDLRVDHYICTELEQANGFFTGRTCGMPNMGKNKVDRLRQWLVDSGIPPILLKEATFYSDSINDLALLSVVHRPIVVDPDPRLESTAIRKGWTVLRFDRRV